LEIINADLGITDHTLIKHSTFIRYWRKTWEYNGTVRKLFIDLKKACDSGEKYCTIFSFNFV